ncbi:MAG TPA: hypothetical protein VMF51_24530 [Nocardioides sp.]|uniref:hypothetical protein n=1 Tax=Nocardioides sp. TaxID=35761 RepID=UPI002BF0F0F6|nr:hypothetical protein [Nocardioides sp.]HTW18313.1 hypothetical protein [Nocardioides sp.]
MEQARRLGALPRRLAAFAGVALLCPLVGPGHADAVGRTQSALCANNPGCALITTTDTVNVGDFVFVNVRGNAGVQVGVRLYLVEFNAQGTVTALHPAGETATARTRDDGIYRGLRLVPEQPPESHAGGWLWVGLADDTSMDFTRRLGELIPYGGPAVRLLGDGYTHVKPVDRRLSMEVIGHVRGMPYWVEYQTEAGEWVDLPGYGEGHPQVLNSAPDKRERIEYSVPANFLGRSEPYKFRIIREYGGQEASAPWDVEPALLSDETETPGKDLDRDGVPDATPSDPTPSEPTPSVKPAPQPESKPAPDKSGDEKPDSKPEATNGPAPDPATTTTPPQQPDDGGGASTSADLSAPGAPAGATAAAVPVAPVPGQSSQLDATGSVWGREPVVSHASGPILQTEAGVARAWGLLGLVLLLAPGGWWLFARRRAARELREPLT